MNKKTWRLPKCFSLIKGSDKSCFIIVLLLLLSLLATIYPLVSNRLFEQNSSKVQSEYSEIVDKLDKAAIAESRKAAEEYNMLLAMGISSSFSNEHLQSASVNYHELLKVNGSEVMCYIKIPALGTELPVAHGTESETLENNVGHVIGTSLPIGGESTHAVLSAHSGMAGKKMFSDLQELETGDLVLIQVLNEELAYRVTEIEKVEPEHTDSLRIETGKDKLTLITCIPIGLNTHRLLVHCERAEYTHQEIAEVEEITPIQSNWQRDYLLGILYGIAALISVWSAYTLLCRWRRKYVKKK